MKDSIEKQNKIFSNITINLQAWGVRNMEFHVI